jgi:hypothetical protein
MSSDKLIQYSRQYYLDNKEKIINKQKEYNKIHHDECVERNKKYYNKEYYRLYYHRKLSPKLNTSTSSTNT